MDYSSFNLEDNGDLLKQLDQVTNTNINSPATMDFMSQPLQSTTTSDSNTPSVDFLNFLDSTTVSNNRNTANNQTFSSAFPNGVPQLSPVTTEGANVGSYTNSSVLSGQNPEYTMSPLQIATQQNGVILQQQQQQQVASQTEQQALQHQFNTPLQHAMSNCVTQTPTPFDDFMDDDEFFTPLVSPAIAPSYDQQFQISNTPNMSATSSAAATTAATSMNVFSPLSSPALNPTNTNIQHFNFLNQTTTTNILDQTTLQQKLAFIERQQQQLRNMHQQIRQSSVGSNATADASVTSPTVSAVNGGGGKKNTANATTSNKRKSMHHSSPRSFTAPTSMKQMAPSPLALRPRNAANNKSAAIAPATPSLLMKLGSGGGGGGGANTSNATVAISNTMSPLSQPALTMAPSVTSPMSLPSSTPSSALSASIMSSSAAVDNMSSLPAAMLSEPPKSAPLLPTHPPKIPKQKTASTVKRRRISSNATASATSTPTAKSSNFSSPGLSPNPSHLVQFSPLGPRPVANSNTMHHSPRTLKPLISPSLQPNGKRLSTIEEETARALLTTKSNYENLKEGTAKHLGIDFNTTIQSGIENRRSAHKAAEQKRRDTLKQSFDALRVELIDAFIDDDMTDEEDEDMEKEDSISAGNDRQQNEGKEDANEIQQTENNDAESKAKDTSSKDIDKEGIEVDKQQSSEDISKGEEQLMEQTKKKKLSPEEQRLESEKEVKQMSKVVLLQHSYEYILRLKTDNRRMNDKIKRVVDELKLLRKQLGLPEETVEEKLERERELQEIKERKAARRKQRQLQLEQQNAKEKAQADAAGGNSSPAKDEDKGKQKE